MARSQGNQRQLVDLPRNWRLISTASLAAFGLACSFGPPALGDWWSSSKLKPAVREAAPKSPRSSASGPKTAAHARDAKPPLFTDNGFSMTIRRLQSDANLHAEKGELDKAVQLAERAAKISEASSQMNGSTPGCSPEQTAQFASDLRSRRDAIAKRDGRAVASPQMAAQEPQHSVKPAPLNHNLTVERATLSAENTIAGKSNSPTPQTRTEIINEQELAWAEDLPPTPAPEAEPLQRQSRYGRSVLNRASAASDEPEAEARRMPDGRLIASESGAAIEELLELDNDLEQPVDLPPESLAVDRALEAFSLRRVGRPMVTAPLEERSREPHREQIQHVAADDLAAESSRPSPRFNHKQEWEDEDLNVDPAQHKPTSTEETQRQLQGTEGESRNATNEKSVEPFSEETFPVQKVVQLRRRLESAAKLNPGGAYAVSSQSRDESIPRPASTAKDAATSSVSTRGSDSTWSTAADDNWTSSTRLTEQHRPAVDSAESQAAISEIAPHRERHIVKLREHRNMSGIVRSLPSDMLPPVSSTRRHAVGHSEPILWQSLEVTKAVVPTLSQVSDIRDRNRGAQLVSATTTTADQRDVAYEHDQLRSSGQHDNSFRIPATGADSPHIGLIELPSGATHAPEGGGSNLFASSRMSLLSATSDGPVLGQTNSFTTHPHGTASVANDRQTGPIGSRPKPASDQSSHGTSRQSFALLESLGASLKLPKETTASLAASIGLALLGVGLLLLRVVFRRKHTA